MDELQQDTQQQEPAVPTTDVVVDTAPVDGAQAEPVVGDAPKEYTPDYGYRFNDEKKEMDEFWKAFVKDPESEKKIRDTLQRAEAVDMYKSKSQEISQQIESYKQLEQEYTPVIEKLEEIKAMYAEGRDQEALTALGFTPERVLESMDDQAVYNEARRRLQFKNLPEEQKQVYHEKKKIYAESVEKERRYQTELQQREAGYSQVFTQLVEMTRSQMSQELARPDVKALSDKFDASNGDGAFAEFVRKQGETLVNDNGRYMTPAEVVTHVMKTFGGFVQQGSSGAPGVGNAMAPQTQQNIITKKASIPSVSSTSGSPAKQGISSMADIKRIRAQMNAE